MLVSGLMGLIGAFIYGSFFEWFVHKVVMHTNTLSQAAVDRHAGDHHTNRLSRNRAGTRFFGTLPWDGWPGQRRAPLLKGLIKGLSQRAILPPIYLPSPKRVLITGATSGIGRACAFRLGREGFEVGVLAERP